MIKIYLPDKCVQNTKGLIFVIDCNDHERVNEAKNELMALLEEDELKNAALLIYANKKDLPMAMNSAEIIETLRLHTLKTDNCFVQSTCAASGDGLQEGLEWLTEKIVSNYGDFLAQGKLYPQFIKKLLIH